MPKFYRSTQDIHRITKNELYNKKQLTKEQIIQMIEEFKNLSYENKKNQVIKVIDDIDFIMDHNRRFAYDLLLDNFFEAIEFMSTECQIEMRYSIKKIINEHPELEQHVKFKEKIMSNGSSIVTYKNTIARNGDINPTRMYAYHRAEISLNDFDQMVNNFKCSQIDNNRQGLL